MRRLEYNMYCDTALGTNTGFSVPAEMSATCHAMELRTADDLGTKDT
jgi:hypothetical protein